MTKRCMIGASLGLAALFLVLAPQVRANGVDNFTLTESLGGGNTLVVTWSLPASPTPDAAPKGLGFSFFQDVTVTYTLNGTVEKTTKSQDINFLDSTASLLSGDFGGIEIVPKISGPVVIYAVSTSTPGTQVFSGTESAPTFTLGTYSFTDVAYGHGYASTLVISTPEPSALLLLLAGILAAAVVLGLKQAIA